MNRTGVNYQAEGPQWCYQRHPGRDKSMRLSPTECCCWQQQDGGSNSVLGKAGR